jgi:hypothetical protein
MQNMSAYKFSTHFSFTVKVKNKHGELSLILYRTTNVQTHTNILLPAAASPKRKWGTIGLRGKAAC